MLWACKIVKERCPYVEQSNMQQENQDGVQNVTTASTPKTSVGDDVIGTKNGTATHLNESDILPVEKKNNVGPWMLMSYRSNRKQTAAGNIKGAQNLSGSRFAPLQAEDDVHVEPSSVPPQPSPNVKELPKIVKFWKQVEAKSMTAMKAKVANDSTSLNRKALNDISNKTSNPNTSAKASTSKTMCSSLTKQQKKTTPKGDRKLSSIQPISLTLPPMVVMDASTSNSVPISNDAATFGHTPPEEELVDIEVSPYRFDRSEPMDTSQVTSLPSIIGLNPIIVDNECNLSSTNMEDMV